MYNSDFEKQISEAMNTNFEGWNFSFISKSGRFSEAPINWNYNSFVYPYIQEIKTLLDMGTGGGEVLMSLSPLPDSTFATESYLPNVEVAKRKLNPIGVEVVYVPDNGTPPFNNSLPFEDNFFDVVINRHEAYYPKELKRILKNRGIFITQQVGFLTCANLLKDLKGKNTVYMNWNLQSAIEELKDCGFEVIMQNEQIVPMRFYDIGAVVYYFKAIPWLIEDFSPEKYDKQLRYLHNTISLNGYYETLSHRFIIAAQSK